MRRCLRCGADMIEGFGINVKHGAYGITITRNEKYRPFGNLAAPKVAICPKCGEISLYLEDLEQMKTAVYYRDFKKNAKRNNENKLLNLRDCPEYADRAAHWFSSKWRIPLEAYEESMSECLANKDREVPGVPQWYMILNENDEIIAGAGVIANDFHDRPDLTPNLCALFVEEAHRKQGLAGMLLNYIREDFAGMGTDRLYLVTDHTNFYERYGWEFFTTVHDEDGPTRLYISPKTDL